MHLPDVTIERKKNLNRSENVQSGIFKVKEFAYQTATHFFPSHCFKLFHSLFSACFCPEAEVRFVNMTAFTRGGLHSSFWIVDRKHIYIGSADMDWRSLSKVTANINMIVLGGGRD